MAKKKTKKAVKRKVIPKRKVPVKKVAKKAVKRKVIPKRKVPVKKVAKKAVKRKVIPKRKVPAKKVAKKAVKRKVIPKRKVPAKKVAKKAVKRKVSKRKPSQTSLYKLVKRTYSSSKRPIQNTNIRRYPVAKTVHSTFDANLNEKIAKPFLDKYSDKSTGIVVEYVDKQTGEVKYISTPYAAGNDYDILVDMLEELLNKYETSKEIGEVTNVSYNIFGKESDWSSEQTPFYME